MELIAALLEALREGGREEKGAAMTKDEVRGLLLTVGLLAYAAPVGGEVLDLSSALDAKGILNGVRNVAGAELKSLLEEVMQLLG